jgi:tetratricopeptide (TPR) repeat protein
VGTAKAAAAKLVSLAQEPGQHPFAKLIITLEAKEAEAFAAEAAGDADRALARLQEAVAIEDSIDDLPQPPYPVIPATELAGNLMLDINRPAEAAPCFQKTLQRTPGRPKAVFGLARAAQATGDNATALERYREFLTIWKDADPDRPEVATAKEFLARKGMREK